jgi:RimJ/RimL family protein N-acetyltransferase
MPRPTATAFAVKPTLSGDSVVLRPFNVSQDIGAIREMLQDPEALKLTGSIHDPADQAPWDDAADARCREWYGSRKDQPDRLDLAIADTATSRFIGEVVFNEWSAADNSCNFRIMMGPGSRGRGLGTEAIRLFIGYGFEQLGLRRISLDVLAFNPRARRAYEKTGFVTEGVLREQHRWRDEWIDNILMSILDHEWRGHHGHP